MWVCGTGLQCVAAAVHQMQGCCIVPRSTNNNSTATKELKLSDVCSSASGLHLVSKQPLCPQKQQLGLLKRVSMQLL